MGAVVTVLAATADLRDVIGFSSFGVLVYYAVANASAWTLDRSASARAVPAIGLVGCLLLAGALPRESVVVGCAVTALGAGVYGLRRWRDARRPTV